MSGSASLHPIDSVDLSPKSGHSGQAKAQIALGSRHETFDRSIL
jgi:hypothetical protein